MLNDDEKDVFNRFLFKNAEDDEYKKYIIDSNRELGNGRFDLMIKDKLYNIGIVIELKITKGDMEEGAIKGLNQIEEKEYYLDLVKDGYKDIRKIAICFKGKKCCIR